MLHCCLKAAHQSGEHEVNLSIFGGNYTVDFETMQQINDDTGTARHVQRKVNPLAVSSTGLRTLCSITVFLHYHIASVLVFCVLVLELFISHNWALENQLLLGT